MNIVEILQDSLTGEPLIDAIVIGISFGVIWEFIMIMFSSIFTIFKR